MGVQVRTLVAVDRRRHRDDVNLARAQIFQIGGVAEALGGLELRRLHFQRAVLALLQLGDAGRLDVEADRVEGLAEFHRQRQPDIAETDHAKLAFAQTELRHNCPGLKPEGLVAEGRKNATEPDVEIAT